MTTSTPHTPDTAFIAGKTDGSIWKHNRTLTIAGCMILLCERGYAHITVNSRRFTIKAGCMAFIAFDMVAVPGRISDDFEARFLTIGFEATQDIFFRINSNRFWEFLYTTPVFRLPSDAYSITNHWFTLLDWIMRHCSHTTTETTLRNETENFLLIMAEQIESQLGQLGMNPTKNRAWLLVNNFLGLLNRYYTHRHDVSFYADKLNITPNYLNIIARRHLGITAKEQINIQIMLVTKMLLYTTDLTIKEISERLHYDDPSYLCRIFRKHTGISPLQYRNKRHR